MINDNVKKSFSYTNKQERQKEIKPFGWNIRFGHFLRRPSFTQPKIRWEGRLGFNCFICLVSFLKYPDLFGNLPIKLSFNNAAQNK